MQGLYQKSQFARLRSQKRAQPAMTKGIKALTKWSYHELGERPSKTVPTSGKNLSKGLYL